MNGDPKRTDLNTTARSHIIHDVGKPSSHIPTAKLKTTLTKKHKLRWKILAIFFTLTVGSLVAYYFIIKNHDSNTLPYPISSQTAGLLGFNIYYPNQKLLPSGYTLNKKSFSDNDQAIIYSVDYGNNQQIVFSVQSKPTASQIQSFYAKHLPLNTTLSTSIGTATIGAINAQTVVSLPTDTNAWLLITAPGNINTQQLNQVIRAIELAR